MKLANWHEIKREAITRMGEEEFNRRVEVARKRARQIAEDPTWFAEDPDREAVFTFMAWRLQSLAVRLTDFAKFEGKDHDTLGCGVLRMIEEGMMI